MVTKDDIAACIAVFYTVDIFGERLMTLAGWYSYVEPVGLAWTSDRGSLSFVWPAIPFWKVWFSELTSKRSAKRRALRPIDPAARNSSPSA